MEIFSQIFPNQSNWLERPHYVQTQCRGLQFESDRKPTWPQCTSAAGPAPPCTARRTLLQNAFEVFEAFEVHWTKYMW